MKDIQLGSIKLKSNKVPAFLYDMGKYKWENIMAGFLQGHVLVRVCEWSFWLTANML